MGQRNSENQPVNLRADFYIAILFNCMIIVYEFTK
jgi:hypothetical protein